MEITIKIAQHTCERLKKYAVPLEDTFTSVIERMIDHYETSSKPSLPSKAPKEEEVISRGRILNPIDPPNLFHTISQGQFGTIRFSNWNELVRVAHIEAFKKVKSFGDLQRETRAQIQKGNCTEKGYHFVPEIGISVQGVDANHAWTYSLRLAKFLKSPICVYVEWRNNSKASHPGESGILEWTPQP
jgi:hypothetical protein